jgi:hypothetical protein
MKKMNRFQKIKSMSIEEMAKFIMALDCGHESIPTLYWCDSITQFDCFNRNCFKCYEDYLKKELQQTETE